jgi:cytochrome d ubiquinol oxidase subunit I
VRATHCIVAARRRDPLCVADHAVPFDSRDTIAVVQTLLAAALAPVQQDYLLEARQMQALSFAVHIPLTCFGIAFPVLVLFVEWLHLRTGDPLYRTLARRWARVMVALFAVGVVTGTILSFELGLLWPGFMASFGSVFGLGFAIEGFAFFLEAIFIAIYVYGWDRLSPRAHFLSGFPIVVTGLLGAAMVIAVNGWMNHPGGFQLADGKAVDVHPWSALFANRFFWHELVHMYFAAYIVVGFVVAGAYAVGRLRGRWGRYERTALAIPLTLAALAAPAQLLVGDWAAREVAVQQPTKLAAFEGLQQTTKGAPEHLLGWYDKSTGEIKGGIAIPKLLSLLAFHDPNATVQGLDAVAPDDRPGPINVVRFAFQGMVGIGTLLAALGALVLFVRWRRRALPSSRWFYRALVAAGPLSVVALICGWVTTEVGRQPWIVYRVMRVQDAVTGAGGIPVGYATLALVYLGLAGAVVWILRRLARAPLDAGATDSDEPPVAAGTA